MNKKSVRKAPERGTEREPIQNGREKRQRRATGNGKHCQKGIENYQRKTNSENTALASSTLNN